MSSRDVLKELLDLLDDEIYSAGWRAGLWVGWAIGTGFLLPVVVWLAVTR